MLRSLRKLVVGSGDSPKEDDYEHIKKLSSGSLQKHLHAVLTRQEGELAGSTQDSVEQAGSSSSSSSSSSKSINSTTSSVSPPTAVSLEDNELALVAASANVLIRSRISTASLYQGALLAEWYYLNAGNGRQSKAVHTGLNTNNIHSIKAFDPSEGSKWGGAGKVNSAIQKVVKVLEDHAGVSLAEFNAELGRAHLEIFRRQGLMSEPYHIRRAGVLLRDCYAQLQEEKKRQLQQKPSVTAGGGAASIGGWFGAATTSASAERAQHAAVQALMYWELHGTKAPEAPSGNNSVASGGNLSLSGSQFTTAVGRVPKRLRYSAREKSRRRLFASLPSMLCLSLQHSGELAEAALVAQHMLAESQQQVQYVEAAVGQAQQELDVYIAEMKSAAASIMAGGVVAGLSVDYSENNSVVSSDTASKAAREEREKEKEKEREAKRREKEKEKEEKMVRDPLAPARAEVLLRKKRSVSHCLLQLLSLHLGLAAFEEAVGYARQLAPKKCKDLDDLLPPPFVKAVKDASNADDDSIPGGGYGGGRNTSAPYSETKTEPEPVPEPDPELPEGLNSFDVMFISGRAHELREESRQSFESPMDGYLPAYATWERIRKARERERMDADAAEQLKWQRAREKAARKAAAAEDGDDYSSVADMSVASNERKGNDGDRDRDRADYTNNNASASVSVPNANLRPKIAPDSKTNAPQLDLARLKEERLKIKAESYRRRKEMRRMRRLGIRPVVSGEDEDPYAKERESAMKRLRNECKKWLANFRIWASIADKCMHLGIPALAADLYRQAILRDNVGYSKAKLWFSWAKACHLCGREYDTKLAINQVQHFEPDNQQVQRIRLFMNAIGAGKSSRHGTNPETRVAFESAILQQHKIVEILHGVVSPAHEGLYKFYAAVRLTSFIRRVADKRKRAREQAERERLENIWRHKPAVEPKIFWDAPADVYYPCFLTRGVQLNARAPLPANSDDEYDDTESEAEERGSDSEEEDEEEEEGGGGEAAEGKEARSQAGKNAKKRKKKKKKRTNKSGGGDDLATLGTLDSTESLDPMPANEIPGTWIYEPDDRADPLPAGLHELRVTFYPADKEVWTHAVLAVPIRVLMNAAPVACIWPDPPPRYIGCTLSAETELNAIVRIGDTDYRKEAIGAEMGTVEYRPVLGTRLPVGTHTLRMVYTPRDVRNYGGATGKVRFTVLPYLTTVLWPKPANIQYPQKLRANIELNAYCEEQGGTFVYTPSIFARPLSVGTHTLMCEFWPYNEEVYGLVTVYTEITVERRTPVIVWSAPPHIYVGEAATYAQHMNAWVSFERRSDVANLTGCFRYSMDEYMRLPPGHHLLLCTFFPDDTLNYTFAHEEVRLTIRCRPKIVWANFPILRFGNAIEAAHLQAKCADCTGTFVYSPALGHVPISGGEQDFEVVFTPDDPSVFDTVKFTLPVNVVNKLLPVITWKPQHVQYGAEICFDNAINATCDQQGTWLYEGSGICIERDQRGNRVGDLTPFFKPCGSYIVQANFIPLDAHNYETVSMANTVQVVPTVIDLRFGPFPDITYGDATKPEHFYCEIVNPPRSMLPSPTAHFENSDFGSFEFSHTLGTILKAGTHDLKVVYTPTDLKNYVRAEVTVPLKVLRHSPVVNWKKPGSIQYSDLITDKQLNAWVSDNVRDLPLESQPIPGLITYEPLLGHRFATVGRHPISVTFVPVDGFNYSTVHIDYEISVRRYPVKIFWNKPSEIFEGMKLTEEQLNATHDFPDLTAEDGRLVYDPPLGKKLESGEHNLLCKFEPNAKVKDNFDLRTSYAEVTIFIAPTRGGVKSRGR